MEAERKTIERPDPLYLKDLDGGKDETSPEEEPHQVFKLWASVELQYVRGDYHRRILGEKTAGLENAVKWARCSGGTIWDRKLSRNRKVAERARNALLRRAQAELASPPPNGIEESSR